MLPVVRVRPVEPAPDVAREATRSQTEHGIEVLAEVDRAGLDVPVVEDFEGNVYKARRRGSS